jgi:hypothetical protein
MCIHITQCICQHVSACVCMCMHVHTHSSAGVKPSMWVVHVLYALYDLCMLCECPVYALCMPCVFPVYALCCPVCPVYALCMLCVVLCLPCVPCTLCALLSSLPGQATPSPAHAQYQYTSVPVYQCTSIPVYQYTSIPVYQYQYTSTSIPVPVPENGCLRTGVILYESYAKDASMYLKRRYANDHCFPLRYTY